MLRRFAASVVVGTSVLFLVMAEGSSAWAQYVDHYGHGHAGYPRYQSATMPSGLPRAYQPLPSPPIPSQTLPGRAAVVRNWGSWLSASAPVVKPFSDYRPPAPINPRTYQYPRGGFRSYTDYQAWSGR